MMRLRTKLTLIVALVGWLALMMASFLYAAAQ